MKIKLLRAVTPTKPGDAGFVVDGVVWTIVGILAIIALVIWIIPHIN